MGTRMAGGDLVENARIAEVNVGEDDVIDGETIEAAEEAEPQRVIPTPCMPSPSDVETHRGSHIPYASWCDECVEGRGREMGHHTCTSQVRTVPTISFDYLFVNNKGISTREDISAGEVVRDGINILVCKDMS